MWIAPSEWFMLYPRGLTAVTENSSSVQMPTALVNFGYKGDCAVCGETPAGQFTVPTVYPGTRAHGGDVNGSG